MCNSRKEKDAKAVEGVSIAEWDKDTQITKVNFNVDKTTVFDIHKAIAKDGHDTEKYTADDEVYEGIQGCCLHERPEIKKKEN